MKRAFVVIPSAVLCVVAACATVTRADLARERTAELRDAVTSTIDDAARAAELQATVQEIEVTMVGMIEEVEQLNREFVDASSDPNVDPQHLRDLAAQLATERRAAARRFLQLRLDLRRQMSADEWSSFAKVLPEFDGGQS